MLDGAMRVMMESGKVLGCVTASQASWFVSRSNMKCRSNFTYLGMFVKDTLKEFGSTPNWAQCWWANRWCAERAIRGGGQAASASVARVRPPPPSHAAASHRHLLVMLHEIPLFISRCTPSL